jgi:hypothetical protein
VGSPVIVFTLLVACTAPKDAADPTRDAGSFDAGSFDAGSFDAGLDAAIDASSDAGPQVPSDSAVFYAIPRGWTHPCIRGPYVLDAVREPREIELLPVNQNVCVLTRIGGTLIGPDDFVSLDFDETEYDGGGAPSSWMLRASSGVTAVAWCARRDCYIRPDYGISRSGPVDALGDPIRPFGVLGAEECIEREAWSWPGDSVSYVSELRGNWSSRNQTVTIEPLSRICADPSAEPGCLTSVRLRSCAAGFTAARAHSFRSNTLASPIPAVFVGPLGEGSADEAGEYVASGEDSLERLVLVDEAMCMITGFAAPLRDLDDWVHLEIMRDRPMNHWWVLRTGSTFRDGPEVRVRCHRFDQASP